MRIVLAVFGLLPVLLTSAAADKDAPCSIEPPYHGVVAIGVTVQSAAQLRQLKTVLASICEVRGLSGNEIAINRPSVLLITHDQYQALKESRAKPSSSEVSLPSFEVLSNDFGASLENAPKQHSGYVRPPFDTSRDGTYVPPVDDNFYTRFSTHEDLGYKWSNITQLYAPHVKRQVIGTSVEGRDIVIFRVGKTSSKDPHRVFLNGLQHAREWIATHAPTYVLETLAESAMRGEGDFAELLKNVEVIIAPMVNPDGYVYSHTTYRNARKNRREAGCYNTRFDGVDLNRNWAVDFGGVQATSTDRCYETYFGPRAFSEPEVDAIRKFVQKTPGIKVHADIHSYGQFILGAWAYTDDPPPLEDVSEEVGKVLQRAMSSSGGERYLFGKGGDLLYLASGTCSDWFTEQGILSYTFELRPSWYSVVRSGFELEEAEILPTAKETVTGTLVLMQFAHDPDDPDYGPFQVGSNARNGLSIGVILAMVIAGVVFAACLITFVILCVIPRWRSKGSERTISRDELDGNGDDIYGNLYSTIGAGGHLP